MSKNVTPWTEEEMAYLRSHTKTRSRKAMAEHLNRSLSSVSGKIHQMGLANTQHHKYSEEEIEWIRTSLNLYPTIKDLTKAFNKKFNCNVSTAAIDCIKTKRKILKDLTSEEKAKLWASYRTDIKDIGDTVDYDDGRGIRIKIGSNKWIPKINFIWETVFFKIPDKYVVRSVNGNMYDFDPCNLVCFPQVWMGLINLYLGGIKNENMTGEMLITALLTCQLKRASMGYGEEFFIGKDILLNRYFERS